jgi:hypothetical protein
LYEEDVHRHLTVFLAMKAGFSREIAELIGEETQGLDNDERDAMYGGGANNANMERYHFASPQRLLAMRKQALLGDRLNDAQLRLVGEFLHAWEDSYSHQDDSKQRDFRKQYHDKHPLRDQDIGHGRHMHEPDWTWGRRIDLTLTMAENTHRQLVTICRQFPKDCSGRASAFESFREVVLDFAAYEPALYEDQFEAGRLRIPVPDVASYEEKVKRLKTPGLSTEGMPEAIRRAARAGAAAKRVMEQERVRQRQIDRNMERY